MKRYSQGSRVILLQSHFNRDTKLLTSSFEMAYDAQTILLVRSLLISLRIFCMIFNSSAPMILGLSCVSPLITNLS